MRPADLIARLVRLKDATDLAIADARRRKMQFDDAVNWGDLGCIAAEYVLDSEGTESFRVVIAEAAPDAGEFRRFIEEALGQSGFPAVDVATEW